MQRIDESELIITADGQVYHINLRPENLAPIVITVGDPDRVKEVSKYFDTIEFKTQHREFVTHTGTLGKKRLTVLSSGIGPDNIDIVMNELDACVNIDFETRTVKEQHTALSIIRFGTSGSLQADIPVDSLVKHTSLEGKNIIPYVVEGSKDLLSHFGEAYHQGITVTCPGFYAPQGRVVRAGLQFPALVNQLSGFSFGEHRITNFEMETSAIFGLGRVFGHHCLAINAIVANRINKTFTKDGGKIIDSMIKKNLEIIEGM